MLELRRPKTAVVLSVTLLVAGCDTTTIPTPLSPVSPARPAAPPPLVTEVLPALGSTAGGSMVKIVGTGFWSGMTVTFGDTTVSQVAYPTSTWTTFYAETPPHAVGQVDLIVTNPIGQSGRLAAAYTYGSEDAFDMNGTWAGFTMSGTETAVEFLIRDNRLVSAACAYTAAVPFTFSNLPRVQNGSFSLTADDGATLSGRIVSASEIVGTINFPACNNVPLRWRVNRKQD